MKGCLDGEALVRRTPPLLRAKPSGERRPGGRGFTLVELLTVIGVISLGVMMLAPALAATRPNAKTFLCRNNLKQLTAAWSMYAGDSNDRLVASSSGITGRPAWISGLIDYNPAHSANWDFNQDIARSPLWPYLQQTWTLLRCPADPSFVTVAGSRRSRVRSISMNHAFGQGEWLNGSYSPYQTVWRIYGQRAEVLRPAKTFLFIDEHPDSINDGSFAVACTGADQATTTKIIDFPASDHGNGACGMSFADGRSETHKWLSAIIKPPVGLSGDIVLNVPAPGAWVDVSWLAENTTVRR
jgi:prepilin-type N-terminal cleavage/methylation domain-containing protein